MIPLLLLVLGCPKTTTPPPVAPAAATVSPGLSAAPAGPPALPGAVPPPGAPATPPLSGRTEAMVLEGLTHSSITFTIGADLTPLDRITPTQQAMLEASLAASPRYRLTRWEGATVAMLRVDDPRLDSTIPYGGYHQGTDQGQPATWRALLRLAPRVPGAEWTDSTLVDRFVPADNVLKVHAFQPTGSGSYNLRAAALEAVGPTATLEIHELSGALELEPLAVAIQQLTSDLVSLDQLQQPTTDAAPWGWLPPGEPTREPPGLRVQRVDGAPDHGGGVEISGRLNPGRAGWTWVRITDLQGHAWLDQLTSATTLERVGWSSDPALAFWFQGRVPTATPLPHQAVVEAWFQADGATEAKQIGRWSVLP